MATVLTKSYQKIATISLTYGEIRTYAKYTSQSTVDNKTTYYLKSTYYIPSQSYIRFDSATAKLDGTSKSYGSTTLYKGETTIQEVSRTITHNSDGSSPTKSVKTEWSATFGGSGTSTASISMPKINRLATITSASDFTDEENPTLSFSNPAGFIIYPYLNFYDKDNNLVHQLIRKSESITSPYTWNITDEERSALWQSTNKQQTYKVNVGVDTYNGTTKVGYNSKAQTMTYVNAEPSQSTVFTETNQKVIDVLGTDTAETLIQNASKVTLVSTPEVKKEATVSKILFEHNNLSTEDKESPYEYSFDVVNSKFKVTIVDSRSYSIPTEYTKTIIEYIPVNIDSFSFKRENPTSSNIKLNAQIRYKQATFGTTENVPTIKWKLGADGELNTLTTDDYTIDAENNKITISNLVLENVLPYTEENRFYLYVNDLLTEDTENEPVLRGIPTCDMGEHDFQVNGDLFVADVNRQNKIDASKIIRSRNEAIVIGLSSDITINPTEQYQRTKLNLSLEMGKLGDKLTLTNGEVKIGKGISKIRVSANGVLSGSTQLTGIIIAKNGDDTYRTFTGSSHTSFISCSISEGILDVKENDLISLYVYTNTTTESRTVMSYDGYATYLCVEAVY